MYSAFRWSTRAFTAVLLVFTPAARAQLPEGPGKAETEKLCQGCHALEQSVSVRHDRAGWETTITKMISLGMKGNEGEIAAAIEYLTANFAAEEIPKLNVNKATAIEFESRLSLRRSEAAALIAYRTKNGPFKSLADLKKVPGIDRAKIEAKKDRLTF
jgi:competence protein ComEA